MRKVRKISHFQTVPFGGFDEVQITCYLWDLLKSIKERNAGEENLADLEKQLHRRVRVEMRRYFARRRRRNVRMILSFLTLGVSVVCLFGFVIGLDKVSGNSMYPYLNDGDCIVYSRMIREIQRGDVVVFERNGENLVKRAAGLPGDRVEISASGDRVVVNGMQVRENYVTLADVPDTGNGADMGEPLTVMDGQYLVLGDNRSVSIDSRDSGLGTIPENQILGKVILILRRRG